MRKLTLVTVESFPSWITLASKRLSAISIEASWQTDTLGTIYSSPTNFTLAHMWPCTIALAFDTRRVTNGLLTVFSFIFPTRKANNVSMLVANVVIRALLQDVIETKKSLRKRRLTLMFSAMQATLYHPLMFVNFLPASIERGKIKMKHIISLSIFTGSAQ